VRGRYSEGADEVGGIGGFLGLRAGVVVDLVGLVLGVRHQLLQLRHVFPRLPQVQRPEILVETVVDQVLRGRVGTLSMLK
jgi:hypothetical protein